MCIDASFCNAMFDVEFLHVIHEFGYAEIVALEDGPLRAVYRSLGIPVALERALHHRIWALTQLESETQRLAALIRQSKAQADLEHLPASHLLEVKNHRLVRGRFETTAPPLAAELQGQHVAAARLDGYWYDSTDVTLQELCPLVTEQGAGNVDDYHARDGDARALHDCLAAQDLPHQIKSPPHNFRAYSIKRQHRENFNEF